MHLIARDPSLYACVFILLEDTHNSSIGDNRTSLACYRRGSEFCLFQYMSTNAKKKDISFQVHLGVIPLLETCRIRFLLNFFGAMSHKEA